jgi:1,4-dihydroxy-2-naphthoate octaprenyltransferase
MKCFVDINLKAILVIAIVISLVAQLVRADEGTMLLLGITGIVVYALYDEPPEWLAGSPLGRLLRRSRGARARTGADRSGGSR